MRSAKISKAIIFTLSILLVFAVAAALLFNNASSLPANDNVTAGTGEGADETAGANVVSADGYTHGSDIGRSTSGTVYDVSTASDLITRITGDQNIRLTGPITLTASDVQSIWNTTYSATLYGNGQTITAEFPSTGNAISVTVPTGTSYHKSGYGGLCGKLTGAIYDLTYVHTGGQLNIRMTGNQSGFAGGLVGSVEGGTIENVKLELSNSNQGRVGLVKESSGSGINPTNYYVAAGALTGRISSGTVKNVTIINDAWIESGVTSGSGSTSVATQAPGHVGNVAGIIGPVQGEDWRGTVTLDNIIVEGTVSDSAMKGDYVANIGTLTTSNLSITVTNFYNRYKNTYDGNASSTTFLKNKASPSLTVSNLYQTSGVTSGSRTDCTVSNTITVSATDYTVGFDPKATDTSNSLVVYKSGVTGGEDYSATIQSANGTTYSNNYAFSDNGSTVIFRNLSTTASDWSSSGNFACTINITQNTIEVTPVEAVNKWESSYTTSQSTSGVAVDNGSKLTTYINSNQDIYLTSDITDFTGFSHTGTYSGTLDGNGHTVYIVKGSTSPASNAGGLFGTLTGTVKNLRVVIYSDYQVSNSTTTYLGGIAGQLNGSAKVENCYVVIPSGVEFVLNNTGNGVGAIGAVAGGIVTDATDVVIENTTVELNGSMKSDSQWTFVGGFVGHINKGSTTFTNVTMKGNGSFAGAGRGGEGAHTAGIGVIANQATSVSLDGYIYSYNGGIPSDLSYYGIAFVLNRGGEPNVSNVYAYGSIRTNSGNGNSADTATQVDVTASTVSTTVDGSSVKVTPYFPAGDTTNLVLVAGDGSASVPDVAYNGVKGTADGNYKVVTVAKSAIAAGSTVTLTEVLTPADPIADLNEWENGYVESSADVPEGYTAVSTGTGLANAIAANENIFLTADIFDYVGFNGASETDEGYTGIFDGNGHTVYIVKANTVSKQYVGGLFGKLKGTVKNVRVVLTKDYVQTTAPSGEPAIGLIAGKIEGKDANTPAVVENVYAYIPSGVQFGINKSGQSSKVGIIAGISGANGINISNTTVHLDGTLTASGSYIFMSAFVGLSQSSSLLEIKINFSDITFKGAGSLDSKESAEAEPAFMGITTIIAGAQASTYTLNGMINAFTGNIAASRWSMYGVLTKNFASGGQGSWNTDSISNIYVYGDNVLEDKVSGQGTYAVVDKNSYIDLSEKKSTVATTVADSVIPVTPYFPISSSENLVLVAGDGTSPCPTVTYGNTQSVADGNYMVVAIAKNGIEAKSNVELQEKTFVSDPTLATTEEELVYGGAPIDVTLNQLAAGSVTLTDGDYTVEITANGGNASLQDGKPLNAGEYTVTVTLLNGYEFEDGSTEKTIEFAVTPFVISGTLSIDGSAVYDKTEKTVMFTADENKGLFNGDSVVIAYNDGDRVNVTETGFTATATVPDTNYTFASGASINQNFKITAKALTVTWGETSFTYDGSEKAPTAEVTEGVIQGDDVTLAVSGAQTAAGQDYTATATISPANANYALTNGTVQFSIAKVKVSVSGADATADYKGSAYTKEDIKAAVFTSGLPDSVTMTVTPESVTNAGESATVTVALVDSNNYEFEEGTITEFTFAVVAKEISLPEASADKSVVYSPTVSYTAAQITELIFGTASIENVTVKVMNGEVEISGDTTVSEADVYTVTATANENYAFADGTTTEYTFEITKAQITLSVSVDGWTYGDEAKEPVISGNDGNGAVTYSYVGTGDTVYEASASAPTNAGTYSLEITVAETDNYFGGTASCDFTIEKAVVSVPTIEDKVYTGETLTADIEENEYYTVTENAGGSEVATYDVVLTLKDADNYKWSDGTETAEITLEFNIVASGNSWVTKPDITGWTYGQYSAETNAPDYQAEKGNEYAVVEFKLTSEADTAYRTVADLSTLDAGAYSMRVSVPKTDDYGGLSYVVTFTVSKAAISVTVSIDGWTYGDEANTPSVSGNTADGAVTYLYEGADGTDYAASGIVPTNAGTYKVTATVAETTNYLGATAEKQFTIAKKAITATVSASNATYNGAEHAASVSFADKVGDDELTANLLYNGEAGVPVNAGSYTVTVGSYGGAAIDNYDVSTAAGEVTLVISPKVLSYSNFYVAPEDLGFDCVYDGKPHGAIATAKEGVLIGSDQLTATVLYNGSDEKPVDAGIYEFSIVISGNDNYVMGENDSAEFIMYQATVNISGSNATAVYTGEVFTEEQIKAAVFKGADLSLVNVAITYGESAAAQYAGDVATLTLTLKDAKNYRFDPEAATSYTFTVTAGTVSLDGENKTATYKGEAYTDDEIKNAIFGEGNWSDFIIEISYNNTAALNAGDIATVKVTGYGDPNYGLDPEMTTEYTFTVETLKVEAPELEADSFVYNGEAQTVSLTDGTYVELSANVQTDKGDYKAVVALKDKTNYEWASGGNADVELSWSISAKEITLKAETGVDKTYDGAAYDFSGYTVTGADGFYEIDNVTVTVSAGTTYTPGSYDITVSYDANDNYVVTVEQTGAKLTINKAPLTIAADVAEIEYTGREITFTFNITDGKVAGDEVEINSVTYRQNGVAVAPLEMGAYDVEFTLKGAQAAYYTALATQVNVTPQTATAPEGMTNDSIEIPEGPLVYNGEAYVATLNYTATDGNVYGIVYHNGTTYVDEAVNAGEYTVYIYKNTKTNIVEGISKTMTVEKRELTAEDITVGGLGFTYSGTTNKVTATGRGVKGEDVTLKTLYNGEQSAPVNAGTYTVTFISDDGNYTVADGVSCQMTVARASVTTPVAKNLTYNASEQTAFDGDQENRYTVGGTYKATDVSAEGYTATFTLVSDNYKWAALDDESAREISVTWNITPADVEITVSDATKTKVYDGNALTEQELAALFTAPDNVTGDGKVTIAVAVKEGGEILNVGEYVVVASIADVNYSGTDEEVMFTVTQATPNVTVNAQDKLLQEGDLLSGVGIFLAEGSTPGTVVWDDPDYVLVKGDNVVNWTYTPDDTLNYTGAQASLTLIVGDEVLTAFELVSGPDKTEYVAFETFDPTGIELKATFDGVYEQPVSVSECETVVENATADGKLTAATTKVTIAYGNLSVTVNVTVARIRVEVPSLDNTSLEYNAQAQTVNVAENPVYEMAGGNTQTNVGSYNAVVGLTDTVNYEWSDGTTANKALGWKITPVTLSGEITLPENLVYDGNAKVATFTLTQGTLYGGAQMSISYELTDGTVLEDAPVNAGTYEVVIALPDTTNYRLAAGTEYAVAMVIEKKTAVITTNGDREKYYDGVEVTAAQLADNFSVTDGLSVNVTVSAKVLNAGKYTVTAEIDPSNVNYTAEPVSYTFTVRKGIRTASAEISVGYKTISITAQAGDATLEYSLDGNVWETYKGALSVGLEATYVYYVRYAESANYNATEAVRIQSNITKDALMQYVDERFEGDIKLADAADVAWLETLAEAATGDNGEFDAKLAELSAAREKLVSDASAAVEKALATGGALRGYKTVSAALALTLGGMSVFAAIGLCFKARKGGKKNEKK